MDILHLVDRLETMLSKGWHIPFTSNIVVQEDAFLDIIDQLRITIPDEVKQAKRLGAERERIIEQARQEADRIVASAHDKIEALVDSQEVVKHAEQRARATGEEARRSAEQIRREADTYVVESLSNLEEELLQLITTVRNGIQRLEHASSREPASSHGSEDAQMGAGGS